MSAHPLDIRMAHLEGAYDQMSLRLKSIDDRLGRVEQKIDRQFLWLVGLILLSILLPLARGFLPS